jgi:transcriptional regulator with AAA-type ATPase domain
LGECLSRRQLVIFVEQDSLLVRNIGRCRLSVNGQVVHGATVRPGDTIYLRHQVLLYCTHRPLQMPALKAYPLDRVPAFGEPDLDGMIGESPTMWKLRDRVAASARTSYHVLVVGESGSGKELAAQAVHHLSARSQRKLIADNIAAIPPSLAAALLFGNKKNFPNPGMEERAGLLGSANGSSLFLDEIGDMPEEVQPMFLRVTERKGEYFRLGEESKLQRSDFRLIGATNRPEKMRYELKRRFQREIRVPGVNLSQRGHSSTHPSPVEGSSGHRRSRCLTFHCQWISQGSSAAHRTADSSHVPHQRVRDHVPTGAGDGGK